MYAGEGPVLMGKFPDCTNGSQVVTNTPSEMPHLLLPQVRFVRGDDAWLSPDYGRDTCRITLTIYNPSDATRRKYFTEVFRALGRFSPRLHWGKAFELQPGQVKGMYPRFEDFEKVRAEMDPSGVFLTELFEQTFGF